MPTNSNEYMKAWRESHKEYFKAYRESHKKELKAWREAHKEEVKARVKAYSKRDVNSSGQTKGSIRLKSRKYLYMHGSKIPGFEIHHCFTYNEPYKFIYCSKETHNLIHAYLRKHNIPADSEHYNQIKHLLDDTVVLYGIKGE